MGRGFALPLETCSPYNYDLLVQGPQPPNLDSRRLC